MIPQRFQKVALILALVSVAPDTGFAQAAPAPQTNDAIQQTETSTAMPDREHPQSGGFMPFLRTYQYRPVPDLELDHASKIASLVQNGVLRLSLQDALELAVDNNLDVEIHRYDLAIGETDVLRAKGGGITRGVDFTEAQVPSGVGGPGSPLLNAAAATVNPTNPTITNTFQLNQIQQVQTNLSLQGAAPFSPGPALPAYDATFIGQLGWVRRDPLLTTAGVGTGSALTDTQDNTLTNLSLVQGFSTGTQFQAGVNNSAQILTATGSSVNPYFAPPNAIFVVSQPLLRGFGTGVNRRYIRIANNDQKINRLIFRQQLIDIVSGVTRLYWDLVSLREDVAVKQETLRAAKQLYSDNQSQVEVGTLPPLELTRSQSLVSSSELDLVRSQGLVAQQENVLKSQLARRGSGDAILKTAKIEPTDVFNIPTAENLASVDDLVTQALAARPDLAQAIIQVTNGQITLEGSKNALRPELDLFGSLQTRGSLGAISLAPSVPNPITNPASASARIYEAGVQLTLPIRNRIAQADAQRDTLQLRQMQARLQQLENRVRTEVQNAYTAVDVARTAYSAAVHSREYQEQVLQADKDRLSVGATSNFVIVQDASYLAQARSTEVAARSTYVEARVALDRAIGTVLENNKIDLDEAIRDKK
ncbi:outer membrane efflux protein [Candidatus Koribacter versatilis Ellin345]|uniref:Outer membrane efflux protein n=1 Tax=Koribacter versatilis (strain Ellin345) TaxID=204669 RepID=Q1INJ8_KORVE|nr:TolC family protein [Candidatus Koribacter versatilis]ABF41552.1 outer membrane efflux protein [Candidatus Koribacter versatilis Ellin345]